MTNSENISASDVVAAVVVAGVSYTMHTSAAGDTYDTGLWSVNNPGYQK